MERQLGVVELPGERDVSAQAVDCAGLGVWEIVAATATWRCSPRCKDLLGIAEDGDPFDSLSRADSGRFSDAIARALRCGEYRLELRAGARWLSANGRVVRGGP